MDVDREKVIRRVMRTVAREQARSPLPVVLDDGTSPLVVALPDDSVEDVFAQVNGFGGSATVLVAYTASLKMLSIVLDKASSTSDLTTVHPVANMGMLCAWLDSVDGSRSVQISSVLAAQPNVRELDYAF